jgi:phospholipid/cholesterol/gamma-HCH transport system substrate-binding protein
MNSENRRSVIVGLFVLVGLAILVAGILVLGGQQNRFAKTVRITADFTNIGGLKKGSNVWFSGVKIGTIREVNFTKNRHVEIVMNIEEKSRVYIRKDAVAALSSEGFIGNKIIEIQGGSSSIPPIEEGDKLQSKEAINTDAMIATLQINNENLVAITENIKNLSDRVRAGEGTVGTLFTDSLMAVNIKAMIANLNQASINSKKITEDFKLFSSQLNNNESLLGQLMSDTAVFSSLRSSAAQLQGITQTASALTSNLTEASEKLNRDDNSIGVLLNDAEVADQLKRTLDNLEGSTQKLDKNMEALQHNFFFKGFFKKEAKKAAKEAAQEQSSK